MKKIMISMVFVLCAMAISAQGEGSRGFDGGKFFSTEKPDKPERFETDPGSFHQNTVLQDLGVPTVLATWLVCDGYGFTAPVQSVDLAGYTGYYIDKHLYLIDPELKDEAIAAIIEKYENDSTFNPENVVLYGNSFTLTETGSLKASLARPEKNKKNLQIKIDIR